MNEQSPNGAADTIQRRTWTADRRGGVCALCGKEFAAGEVIFRFRSFASYSWNAACCSACRAPDSKYVQWSTPAPCAGCGRLMAYQLNMPGKTPTTCSPQCSINATKRKRQPKPQQRACTVCKADFTPERSDALTCSHRCRQKAYRNRARDNKKQVTISPTSNRHGDAEK